MVRNGDYFSQAILRWYEINKRDLPWRKEHIEPYYVVVSEIMLQQTQVPRVIEKFKEFIDLFPTVQDLAKASKADVVQAWSGLGYNRRALMLHTFAQQVCEKYNGKIPTVPEVLVKLSGIGAYTAGAITSFAFNKPEPAVDVNVRRIYMRYFFGKDRGLPMGNVEEKKLFSLVKESIPERKSRDLHNALMDFGSLVCLRDKPLCLDCPLKRSCAFFPFYEIHKEKALFVAEKRQEKGIFQNGKYIPNRIFRGRIVEFVRKNERKKITLFELGSLIKHDFQMKEIAWLKKILVKLQKDGLLDVSFEDDEVKLSLSV